MCLRQPDLKILFDSALIMQMKSKIPPHKDEIVMILKLNMFQLEFQYSMYFLPFK